MKYDEYIKTYELLSIQKAISTSNYKDEITFIVVHQVSELLLKLLHMELDEIERLDSLDVAGISRCLSKSNEILTGLVGQLRLCRYVPENVFFMIRDEVYPATAQESEQFKNLFYRVNCAEGTSSQILLVKLKEALENTNNDENRKNLLEETQKFKWLIDDWQKEHIDLARQFLGGQPGAVTSGAQYLIEKYRLSVFPKLEGI